MGRAFSTNSGRAAQIENSLALFRCDFAPGKWRLQKRCACFPHLLGKQPRPMGGDRAGLDYQLRWAKFGLDLIQDGLHSRWVDALS
jgi:hypothetical protein